MCVKKFWSSAEGGTTGFEMNDTFPAGHVGRQFTARKRMNPLWDVED